MRIECRTSQRNPHNSAIERRLLDIPFISTENGGSVKIFKIEIV